MLLLSNLSNEIKNKWNSVPVQPSPEIDSLEPKHKPQPGSHVVVLRENFSKLYGLYVGPYVIKQIFSQSSLLNENPITRTHLKTSIHLIKPCFLSLPD
ncbi:hypothetical protein P9112_002079 [Eukaryota sp. TZLM1-RC]